MPSKRRTKKGKGLTRSGNGLKRAGNGRRMKRGGSILKWLKKANQFLRKHRLISRGIHSARALGYSHPVSDKIGRVASKVGYGKRRRRKKCH